MKVCKSCKEEKDLSEYYIDRGRAVTSCKVCRRAKGRTAYNPERNRNYRLLNKESIAERRREWYLQNKSHENEYSRTYKKERPHLRRAYESKRRAIRKNSRLLGFDQELKKVYENCPAGYHVDHIIPLKGKNVTGLHVPWNLQYLTPEDNMKKSNKFTGGEL